MQCRIDSLDDPRVAPYRRLKDRELARAGDLFIAEGEQVVLRLLDSDFPVESVLLAERRAAEMAPLIRADVPVYIVPDELIHQIIGFKFHAGVIGCGRRKPPASVREVIPASAGPLTLAILPETANAENLGALIRISAAFGVDAMVLGERCCDPFWRQAIRVSMGAVFRLPIVRSTCLDHDLKFLREDCGVQLAATVLDEDAEPLATAQHPAPRSSFRQRGAGPGRGPGERL